MRYSNFEINADSTPLYDTWGWADYWACADWINWHKALKQKHGTEKANQIWANAWLEGVSNVGGGKGTAPGSNWAVDSVPLDCRSFNSEFRDYIKKYPPLYSAVYPGATSTIVKPFGVATDIVEGVSSGVSSTAKVIKYLLPISIILITGFIAWKIYKKNK